MAATERGRTVFVRNLSYDVDDQALEEAFNDVGPVRQAFLVKDKGQPRHKGFGYVQFALAEDAERAVAELQGRALAGRSIKVEIAAKRAPFQERKAKRRRGDEEGDGGDVADVEDADEAPPAEAAEAPSTPAAAPKRARKQAAADGLAAGEKHNLIRTVAIGNLTPEAAPAAIAAARAASGFETATDPAPPGDVARAHLTADGCSGHVIFVQYATVKDANAAVAKLHGQTLSQLAVTGGGKKGGRGKKGSGGASAEDGEEGGGRPLWARVVTGEGAHIKKWRIILRNLPFQATEADVRRILAPAGFVWSVDFPKGADGRVRGFAFAAFTNPQDAGKGIAVANGAQLRKRQVAADWAVAKKQYQEGGAAAAADAAAGGGKEEGGEESSEDEDQEGSGSMEEEDEQTEEEEEEEEEAGLGSSEEEGSEEGEEEAEEEEEEDPDLAQEHGMVYGVLDQLLASDSGAASNDKAAARSKGAASETVKGKQSKGAADDQQQQQPKKQQWEGERAGPVTEGSASGASKGGAIGCTVFVRGLALDATSQELQARLERFGPVKACRIVMNKSTGTPKGTAFVEFRTPAGAAAAAEACARARAGKGPEVQLRGRGMEIDAALDKEGAKTLAIAQAAAKGAGGGVGADRRNLYLGREGHIEEGSAAWQSMSEYDRSKRKRAAEEKNAKLKSPNFAVSTLRLSVRNIPASWDEARLKKLFVGAVKERATKENPTIKQAKILRDTDRPDPNGDPRGKSKGIGFVEFDRHDHALAALRQLNNNPAPFGAERRPLVEFAIENVKVLKMRDDRVSKQKARRAQETAAAEGGEAAAGSKQKKKTRVERRQERKQQERKQQQQNGGGGGVVNGEADGKQQQRQHKPQQNGQQHQKQKPNGTKQQQQQQHQNAQQAKSPAPNSKAARSAAAAAAKAKATEASAAARAAKAAQQQRREAGAAQRKRRADDALDALATTAAEGPSGAKGGAGGAGAGKRRRGGADRAAESKLEGLVADFKARMFGGAGGVSAASSAGKKGSGGGGAGGAIRRWFE